FKRNPQVSSLVTYACNWYIYVGYISVGGFSGVLSSYGQAIAHMNISSNNDSGILISLANVLNTTNYTSLTQLASSPEVSSSLRCSLPSPNAFILLRGITDPDMPWLGFLLGQTPASIWYWCADQMMVQRVLAAKSLSHAQGATLMAGLIKQLPLFLMVIPGMISRILFPDVFDMHHNSTFWVHGMIILMLEN
ncbi:hypothetical protein MN116_000159, partial [Schistosoma mekongi]